MSNKLTDIAKTAPPCQYCFKPESEAEVLVLTPTMTSVCDSCIMQFYNVIQGIHTLEKETIKEIGYVPADIVNYLDKYVIGQDHAKRTLAVAVYQHYKKLNNKMTGNVDKNNIMLLGPTGSGKTAIITALSKFLGVPFIIYDCTQLTETGYVGQDVDDILGALYHAADKDIAKAQRGIICLDEVDKLQARAVGRTGIGGISVQRMLLKTLESNVIQINKELGRKSGNDTIGFDTSNVLFIGAGAFTDLPEVIKTRSSKTNSAIGFGASVKNHEEKPLFSDYIDELGPEDLITYGLIPEFVGRFAQITYTDALTEDVILKILTEPVNSFLNQQKSFLALEGIDLNVSLKALKKVSAIASKHPTGARALKGLLADLMKDSLYHYPSHIEVERIDVKVVGGKFKILLKDKDNVTVKSFVHDVAKAQGANLAKNRG